MGMNGLRMTPFWWSVIRWPLWQPQSIPHLPYRWHLLKGPHYSTIPFSKQILYEHYIGSIYVLFCCPLVAPWKSLSSNDCRRTVGVKQSATELVEPNSVFFHIKASALPTPRCCELIKEIDATEGNKTCIVSYGPKGFNKFYCLILLLRKDLYWFGLE